MQGRLLVIDDSPRFAKTVSRTASLLGYATAACTDPHQALDAFLSFGPDVVVVDLCQPEKDGIEIADEILLTGRPVGLVFTSGYGAGFLQAAQDAARFHDHPNVTVLAKPFQREQFAAALHKVLPPARQDGETPDPNQPAD